MKNVRKIRLAAFMLGHISLILASASYAGNDHDHIIKSPVANDKVPAFDILQASADMRLSHVSLIFLTLLQETYPYQE